MKKTIFILFLVFSSTLMFSQQYQLINNLDKSRLSFNPSVAGLDKTTSIVSSTRFGSNFISAPISIYQTLNFDMPIESISSGFGLNTCYNDLYGWFNIYKVNLSYSYHLPIDKFKLSFGIAPGFTKWSYTGRITNGLEQPPLAMNEDDNFNATILNLKMGTHFEFKKLFFDFAYCGYQQNTPIFSSENNKSIYHDFTIFTGYEIELKNIKSSIKPSIMGRSQIGFYDFRVSLLYNYNNKFELGMSYSDGQGFSPVISFSIFDKLTIGYSYDYLVNRLQDKGTHELLLKYTFSKND